MSSFTCEIDRHSRKTSELEDRERVIKIDADAKILDNRSNDGATCDVDLVGGKVEATVCVLSVVCSLKQ